jgi:hypothetical protein
MDLDLPHFDCQLPDVGLFSPEPRLMPFSNAMQCSEQAMLAVGPFDIDAEIEEQQQQDEGLKEEFIRMLPVVTAAQQRALFLQEDQHQQEDMLNACASEGSDPEGYWERLEKSCLELQKLHQEKKQHQQGQVASPGEVFRKRLEHSCLDYKQPTQGQQLLSCEDAAQQTWLEEKLRVDAQGDILQESQQQCRNREDLQGCWEEQQQDCEHLEDYQWVQSHQEARDGMIGVRQGVAEAPSQFLPGSFEDLLSPAFHTKTNPRSAPAAAVPAKAAAEEPLSLDSLGVDILFQQDLFSPEQGSCGPSRPMRKRCREQHEADAAGLEEASNGKECVQGLMVEMEFEVMGDLALHTFPAESDCSSEASVTCLSRRPAVGSVKGPGVGKPQHVAKSSQWQQQQHLQQSQQEEQNQQQERLALEALGPNTFQSLPQKREEQLTKMTATAAAVGQQGHAQSAAASGSVVPQLPPFAERLVMSAPPHPKRIRRAAHSNPISSLHSRVKELGLAGHSGSGRGLGLASESQQKIYLAERRSGSGGAGKGRGHSMAVLIDNDVGADQWYKQRGTVRGVLSKTVQRGSRNIVSRKSPAVEGNQSEHVHSASAELLPRTGTAGAGDQEDDQRAAACISGITAKAAAGIAAALRAESKSPPAELPRAASEVLERPAEAKAAAASTKTKLLPSACVPARAAASLPAPDAGPAIKEANVATNLAAETCAGVSAAGIGAPRAAPLQAAADAAPGATDLCALRQGSRKTKLTSILPFIRGQGCPFNEATADQQKQHNEAGAATAARTGTEPVGSVKVLHDQIRPILKAPGSGSDCGGSEICLQRKRVRFSVGNRQSSKDDQHGSGLVRDAGNGENVDAARKVCQGLQAQAVTGPGGAQQQSGKSADVFQAAPDARAGAASAAGEVPTEISKTGESVHAVAAWGSFNIPYQA